MYSVTAALETLKYLPHTPNTVIVGIPSPFLMFIPLSKNQEN